MFRIALAVCAFAFLSACTLLGDFFGGKDNAIPPSPLTAIEESGNFATAWETRIGNGSGDGYLRFALANRDGQVFACSNDGTVSAVDAESGAIAWSVNVGIKLTAGVGLGDNMVFVGGGEGEVVALRQDTGEQIWRKQLASEILAAPAGADGVVVVRSSDGRFIGLNEADGEQLWQHSVTIPALSLRGESPVLIGEGVAVAGLDNGRMLVLSLEEGLPVFEKTVAPPRGRTELERMVDLDATPKVADNVLYLAAYQGNVTAVSLDGGGTIWSREISSHTGMDTDASTLYISDDEGNVWGLDRDSGGTMWKQPDLKGRRLSAPVVVGDTIAVSDFEGYVHWLETSSGNIVGRSRVGSSAPGAAPVTDGTRVFLLSRGGELAAINTP